ncbi:MAG TPA: LysE family translocator [Bauldia sp.]|nr:LysE family translocator [Bauldia sp.]
MEAFLPLLGYVVVSAVTPGPNNLMMLQSGANFGLARTVPHILGVTFGFPVMIVAVGLGLTYVFDAYPIVHEILKWLSFAFLLWLAWQIASAGRPDAQAAKGKPVTFLQAAAFQWINPKGWAMSIGALALFITNGGNRALQVGIIALLFGAVCFPNGVAWTLFGRAIAGFLENERNARIFNIAMALLLIVSVTPTLFE